MAAFLKAASLLLLLLLSLFFVSAPAQFDTVGGSYGPGSNSLDKGLNDILNGKPSTNKNEGGVKPNLPGITFKASPRPVDRSGTRDFPTTFLGTWKMVSRNSMVSAMHMNLLPNNKMIMFDASAFHISQIKLPNGKCFPFKTDQGEILQDCWAHGVEFDIETAKIRPLTMPTDPWCSSGGLDVEGRLVNTGGWMDGTKTATMPDGGFILVGGRRSFDLEFVPPEGKANAKAIKMPFLDETTDLDENNLYPFVHLSTDGNVFIFANSRSILFNPKTQTIVYEYPVLDGGARNYPASGMSALLPLKLSLANPEGTPAEVIVCGGAKPEAYRLAEKGNFLPALQDCNRIEITKPKDVWKKEMMPSPRVMGDMLILPTGDLLIINGATSGTSAWNFAEAPNYSPILYNPDKPQGQRFKQLIPTTIPRMYHSTSAVLPDGQILVAGSNTNAGYLYQAVKYPTELRVEKFSPPYLDPAYTANRPAIQVNQLEAKWQYGQDFVVNFNLIIDGVLDRENDIRVNIYPPPFTTHGYSMNQRLVVLPIREIAETGAGIFSATVVAPPSGIIAPPGYYMLFVVYRGIPSVAAWIQIK
ncbi:WSC domain-containing protein [Cucumis melo var. makuwa]|uniref:WSC domain-containing protein n=1 Tax=Cucumis melo var. makuwa TaxID=1194695 RepID=A0A5A7V085_CUCMM|nr:WSC domain-containing protein [Cucumis melo var. makuwa]